MCEYCKNRTRVRVAKGNFCIRIIKRKSIYYLEIVDYTPINIFSTKIKISACPHCGRKLGDE